MDIDDKELFQAAISDEPIAEVETTQVEETPVSDGTVRDEQGRFAPKEPKATEVIAEKPATQEQQGESNVPSWRLREVNEAREAAERRALDNEARAIAFERQLAELRKQSEPKPEPVDFFADPELRIKQTLSPIEERMQAMQSNFNLRASKVENIAIHGRAAIDEMEAELGKAMSSGHPELPLLRQQMMASDDPVGIAMNWYQREKLQKETGGDLTAYRTRVQEDALKDPAFLARALEAAKAHATGQAPGSKPSTVVQLPPSIGRATSAASPHEEAGDMSDRGLFAYATK
jgi:hypothetical protein